MINKLEAYSPDDTYIRHFSILISVNSPKSHSLSGPKALRNRVSRTNFQMHINSLLKVLGTDYFSNFLRGVANYYFQANRRMKEAPRFRSSS